MFENNYKRLENDEINESYLKGFVCHPFIVEFSMFCTARSVRPLFIILKKKGLKAFARLY